MTALSCAARASAQHDMQHMAHTTPVSAAAEGSGTSWLPADTPMFAVHREHASWTFMVHGNAFLQYLSEGGDRGSHQVGSVNWVMAAASRPIANGRVGVRGMMSAEPWTIRGCGYPDLLATGESCKGQPIHDRQHPHDLVMELAATYDRPLGRGMSLQLYGGPAGEPALGPAAFPHRISAMPNPLAPITHHWLDATHITFGVATAGIYGSRWKAEASAFNGREPDEHRTNIDVGALDSLSGRLWFLPTARWVLQVSAGRLNDAEAGHDGVARVDLTRVTASATYHRLVAGGDLWATTLAWGRNQEQAGEATQAFLAETNVTVDDRHTWFGRFELSGKTGHDLAIERDDIFTVAKLQAGYTRYLAPTAGLQPGVGGQLSAGIVPASLGATYGRRVNAGFGIFLTLRPARMRP